MFANIRRIADLVTAILALAGIGFLTFFVYNTFFKPQGFAINTNGTAVVKEIQKLSKVIRHLDSEKPFDIMKNPGKFMWYALLKGLMLGFGSVLGGTVLVAIALFLLSKIEFIPILGEFIQKIITQIQATS